MARGRKPRVEPSAAWKVYIPVGIANAVERELLDPLTELPAYGERSKLITLLLKDWLAKRRQRSG
jgi:hypothetical protein